MLDLCTSSSLLKLLLLMICLILLCGGLYPPAPTRNAAQIIALEVLCYTLETLFALPFIEIYPAPKVISIRVLSGLLCSNLRLVSSGHAQICARPPSLYF